MFKVICISSFRVLKILNRLVKILNCSILKSVGSYRLLFMLTICVFNVSSRVWVRNVVEILKGLRSSCYVVPLSWCGHQFRNCAFRWFVLFNYITMHGDKHKKHFTCREIYLRISAFTGGIFLQLRTLHLTVFPCRRYKVVCDRSIIKTTFLGEQRTFAVMSCFPLEAFSCNVIPPTLHICVTSIASLVAFGQ
jgi:hypothetical protein